MKKLFLILAAVTMIFVACKKEDNNTATPVKHTVLAGMDVDKMVFYGDVIYYYTYDADYRLVRIKELQAEGKLKDISDEAIASLTKVLSEIK